MNEIIIIGTEPPCPRCGLLTAVIRELAAELGIDAGVRHLAYTDEEAAGIAAGLNLRPGTAKDVAAETGKLIDRAALAEMLRSAESESENEFAAYNKFNWKPELDEYLKPWQDAAEEAGIMMTPVLFINGEKKHQGSLPPLGIIRGWLSELSQ